MKSLPKIKISPAVPLYLLAFFMIYGKEYLFAIVSTVLLHEIGHITAIYLTGGMIEEISFCSLGAVIKREEKLTSYGVDIFISLAGIIVNLLSFFICLLVGYMDSFAAASLILALFNLIPARRLDGYNALMSASLLFFPAEKSEKLCKCVSFVFLSLLWLFALYLIIYADFNIYIIVALTFMLANCMI